MKIYKVTASHYKYWKTAFESGHVAETHYFANEENARAFYNNEIANPYWIDHDGKHATPTERYHKPSVEIEVIETED